MKWKKFSKKNRWGFFLVLWCRWSIGIFWRTRRSSGSRIWRIPCRRISISPMRMRRRRGCASESRWSWAGTSGAMRIPRRPRWKNTRRCWPIWMPLGRRSKLCGNKRKRARYWSGKAFFWKNVEVLLSWNFFTWFFKKKFQIFNSNFSKFCHFFSNLNLKKKVFFSKRFLKIFENFKFIFQKKNFKFKF